LKDVLQAIDDCSDAISLAMDCTNKGGGEGPPEWLGQAFLERGSLLEQAENLEGSLGDYRAAVLLLSGNRQVGHSF